MPFNNIIFLVLMGFKGFIALVLLMDLCMCSSRSGTQDGFLGLWVGFVGWFGFWAVSSMVERFLYREDVGGSSPLLPMCFFPG